MIVSSETLARLRKRTCSPEPSHITYVISTSRLFTKFIWGIAQVDFMFGFDWKQNKQSIFLSLHGSVFECCNDPTHHRHRRVNLHPLDVLSENNS